tara:strand:+ start:296 stop:634 length:339 start_codon:yes stop_codon:yes gene_type:complete
MTTLDISGIGVDIEDISRFRDLPFDSNKEFYSKLFTSDEIAYCNSKKDPYQHFAARFCAKEAFVKALGKKDLDYKKIEIHSDGGKPSISFEGKKALVSFAHEKDKAIAFVMV